MIEPTQRRRTAAEARERILLAAEKRLIEGGPDAIRVQHVARDLDLTDAAIYHHFESRDGLIDALLRFAGRRLKERLASAIEKWDRESFDIQTLMDFVGETYADRGYARLAAWMVLAGWKPLGSGLYREFAETIHQIRVQRSIDAGLPAPDLDDTLFAVALINMILFAEPLVGDAMRRSVRLAPKRETANRHRDWFVGLLEAHLNPSPGPSAQ